MAPRQIIRADRDPDYAGEPDDVVIDGDLFRMERMDADRWWVCIYRGDQRVAFDLYWEAAKGRIVAAVIEDDLGCIDDSEADAAR